MEYLLKKVSILNAVGIFAMVVGCERLESFQEHAEYNPIMRSADLRSILTEGADRQQEPYIYMDGLMVYFACIKKEHKYYMIGPMSLRLLDLAELHQYYRNYGMKDMMEKKLAHFTFSEMLDIVELVSNILSETEYGDDELIYANQLVKGTKEQEEQDQVRYDMKEGEEELYHHTYQEEGRLLDSIREGHVEDALWYMRNMDVYLGKLSRRELNHWKNVAIVAITLCTRAAIDGGISPSIAYRISDFYIQKSDGCNDIAQTIKFRDHAVEKLAEQVLRKKSRRTSSYVERCKDYVDKHYRKKIYLSDMAENLGLSETYLSRLFKKDTGVCMQDYIVSVRLEHAANMLKYSDESILDIAEYVNFPSQSYMGKVFKEKYQLSPKKYREQNSPTEFFSGKFKKKTKEIK